MRSPRFFLILMLLLLCGANLVVTFLRSGIPYELDGMVRRIEIRLEKHAGRDDVYLVTVGERTLHLDRELAARLRRGDRLSKSAWGRDLHAGTARLTLETSRDFQGMALTMPLMLLLGLLVLFARPSGADRGRMET